MADNSSYNKIYKVKTIEIPGRELILVDEINCRTLPTPVKTIEIPGRELILAGV